MLNEALRKHLQGRPAGPADLWLARSDRPVSVDVEPLESGWQVRVPSSGESQHSSRADVLDALGRAVGWDAAFGRSLTAAPQETLWVWIPSHAVRGIVWRPSTPAAGIDYIAKAREAWALLRSRALQEETMTYGDLGHALGGLHPLHDVPQVLDIIQRWCHEHDVADLTGVVVSQRTGHPGRDYWRQNGWATLTPAEQEMSWRQSLRALQKNPGPEIAPF